jgi:uncharacterized protein
MRVVFADTLYWVATARPGDQWAEPARRARAALSSVLVVTTDEVLSEFLTLLSGGGEAVRRRAIDMVRAVLTDRMIRVIAQSRESFLRGLSLYERRLDQEYSLTDCVIMQTMRAEGITDILSADRHFAQEGFNVLMRKSSP